MTDADRAGALPIARRHAPAAVADPTAGEPDVAGERPDLRDEDFYDLLVVFYERVGRDPQLAPYFAALDMQEHLPRIVDFWSTMLFDTGLLGQCLPAAPVHAVARGGALRALARRARGDGR